MKLKANERCPIHRSKTCCGRQDRLARSAIKKPLWNYIGPGVKLYPDGHIERSQSALKRVKDDLLRRGYKCAACGQAFDDYEQVELAHVRSKGFSGSRRNDATENLVLMHRGSNRAQGSLDLDTYLGDYWKPEHCK